MDSSVLPVDPLSFILLLEVPILSVRLLIVAPVMEFAMMPCDESSTGVEDSLGIKEIERFTNETPGLIESVRGASMIRFAPLVYLTKSHLG